MRFVFAILCAWIVVAPARAGALVATIRDAKGAPLEHAVISIHGLQAQVSTDQSLAIMDQQSRRFTPTVLAVQQGTRVSFPNSDDVRHHVYSFSRPNQFELKLYHGESSSPVQFEHPGLVVLGCNIHDTMVGYLQVVDTPWFDKSDANGRLRIESIPAGDYTLQLWHPDMGFRYDRRPLRIGAGEQRLDMALPAAHGAARIAPSSEPASPLQALFDD